MLFLSVLSGILVMDNALNVITNNYHLIINVVQKDLLSIMVIVLILPLFLLATLEGDQLLALETKQATVLETIKASILQVFKAIQFLTQHLIQDSEDKEGFKVEQQLLEQVEVKVLLCNHQFVWLNILPSDIVCNAMKDTK